MCIDIPTRTVYIAGITDHPTGVWITQAARNLLLRYGHRLAVWVPETRPWSLTCRDAGRC